MSMNARRLALQREAEREAFRIWRRPVFVNYRRGAKAWVVIVVDRGEPVEVMMPLPLAELVAALKAMEPDRAWVRTAAPGTHAPGATPTRENDDA
jgi:hypothetical protein